VTEPAAPSGRYKWVALSNTTIGILMATINSSIVLIALPDIFRGIQLDPLQPENSSYLLWMIMGFLVATAVLVVSFGRVGDIYGRVRMFTLGFAIFTVFSLLLSITWMTGPPAAIWMIVMRIGQGVGGAFLFANSSAILTDAFPSDQRGMALGVNAVAGIAGSFIGLVVGGILGPIDWRLVFLVSVPVGLFGTVWSWMKLEERGIRQQARIDWWGNITFALGLIAVLVAITYGIQPYGGHVLGWTNPRVVGAMVAGLALLATFVVIELRTEDPMFRLSLFRIRAFSFGNIATLLASLGRGGLMFMLIIWLQGIWLPLHGYSFEQTPLWAGVYMLPLTVGFLIAGPTSGLLSDRFGARPFATGGMLIAALSFYLLERLPVDFGYPEFAALLVLIGIGMGLFTSPNQAGIMNSLPPNRRGAGAGMATTFQNSALVLSIGIFFTLMVVGLAGSLPGTLDQGLRAQGVAPDAAQRISQLPPVGLLFSSFLGYNPMHELLGGSINHLSAHQAAYLTSRHYFPQLIAKPFEQGLSEAFDFAIFACLTAAAASWFRGGKYVHGGEHVRPVVESGDGELAMASDGD
jgi:EmrB/QacA subfamily drug resistance transporter